jgi:uncharacterized protein (DUF4415 family)
MSAKTRNRQGEPDLTDPDNPEWTKADFARAVGPEGLSDAELAAFPNTKVRGRPALDEGQRKQHVSLRMSPDVLAFFKGKGKGWQGELDAAARSAMERELAKGQVEVAITSKGRLVSNAKRKSGTGEWEEVRQPARYMGLGPKRAGYGERSKKS